MTAATRTLITGALGLLIACAAPAEAQTPPDPHAAQPERPSVATHAGTVAPGWIEIEAGGEVDRYSDETHGGTAPIVAKVGLAPKLQLSLFGSVVRPPGASTVGAGDFAVGVKWRLTDAAPALGRFSLLPIVKVPSGSFADGMDTTDVSLIVISSHDFGPITLDLNAGYTHRHGPEAVAPANSTLWTASFGGSVAGSVGWGAEVFGYPKTTGPASQDSVVALLFGPTVTLRPWLVLDAGVIAPLTGPQPRAVYFGATWNAGQLWR